jgi:hypothetical protein
MDSWHRRRLRSVGFVQQTVRDGFVLIDNVRGCFLNRQVRTNGFGFCVLQLAETRAQLSEAATREETSQLELDAATADVSSERELSAANARRGVATDALRVEADGAQHRAEAAQEVA